MNYQIGQIVPAKVKKIFHYGVLFSSKETLVMVLIPELSWKRVKDINELFKLGEICNVKLIKYISEKNEYVGSIKSLDDKNNPYIFLKRHERKTVGAKVINKIQDSVVIEMFGHWYTEPIGKLSDQLEIDDVVNVEIICVIPDDRYVEMKILG
jgi:ribosomal protein S1